MLGAGVTGPDDQCAAVPFHDVIVSAAAESDVADFAPFRGLRYDTSNAGPLSGQICPPYDVIDEKERERLYARSPYNFVRIEFPIDGAHDRYAHAAEDLHGWIRQEVLRRDGHDSFYLHEHEFEVAGRRLKRRGIFGACAFTRRAKGSCYRTS